MSADTQERDTAEEIRIIFQVLPSRFKRGVAQRLISYYFSIDEQDWTVFISSDSCEIHEGKAVESADCFLKTTGKIFLGTVKGEYTPSFMDLMTGKIKTNNPALLQTFKEVFGD